MSSFTIHQILSCPVPMTACHYDFDSEEVIRKDVIVLAVIYDYPESEDLVESKPIENVNQKVEYAIPGSPTWNLTTSSPIPNSLIRPMIMDETGDFTDPCWEDNYLGIECGIKLDWDEQIRKLVDGDDGDGADNCECDACRVKKNLN